MDASSWQRELDDLRRQGLFRERRTVRSLPDGWCELEGGRLRNLASNDYLNLAHDRRLVDAARQALESTAVGAASSALICGRTSWHAQLEDRLARFEGTESAILFPTGFAANLGTISALVGAGDAVFCDRFNHASLVDGCRLSGARLRVYRHDRLERLERELSKAAGYARRLIVTDGVFSMDGNVAPLPELCDLAERFDAAVLVDEAHGTGVLGRRGRGATEHCGVEHRVAVRVGTLSKAIATLGGFVAGSRALIDWLWNKSRPQIYSTALPPAVCAAAVAALDVIDAEPSRRDHLSAISQRCRDGLQSLGLNVPTGETPIVPVILGDPDAAMRASQKLADRGWFIPAVRPPTVPRDTSRLRISLTAAFGEQDVDDLISALRA